MPLRLWHNDEMSKSPTLVFQRSIPKSAETSSPIALRIELGRITSVDPCEQYPQGYDRYHGAEYFVDDFQVPAETFDRIAMLAGLGRPR